MISIGTQSQNLLYCMSPVIYKEKCHIFHRMSVEDVYSFYLNNKGKKDSFLGLRNSLI